MASSNDIPKEIHADKVVVVNGPTFGTALKLVALGSLLGAAGAYLLLKNDPGSLQPDAVSEGLTAGHHKPEKQRELLARINKIAGRLKKLAGKAGASAKTAGRVLGPVVAEALIEARSAAVEAEHEIREELERTQNNPSIAPEQA